MSLVPVFGDIELSACEFLDAADFICGFTILGGWARAVGETLNSFPVGSFVWFVHSSFPNALLFRDQGDIRVGD